ncbi:MAG: hypothetical protein MUC92_03645 [Fimbriimonadaceae bacterium]|jgi:tetratricopeptide (TPR) repeat protein|nr:hypothetical protein [Fimbriimonadaceae bacterium]
MQSAEHTLAEAKAATEKAPGSAIAWAAYGAALLENNQPEEAAKAYKESNMLNGKQADVLFGLGKALALAGDNYHAVPALEESVKIDPKNPEARALLVKELILRGNELKDQANLWGAEQYYEKAFKYDRKNDEVYDILTAFYVDTGQQAKIAQMAYEAGKTNVMPSIQTGEASTVEKIDHSGEVEAAILSGEGSEFLKAGYAALEAKDYPKAVEEFRKASTCMAGNIHLSLGLGKAYAAVGDNQHAVHALQDALERDSHNQEARELLKKELIIRGHELKAEANLLGAEQYYEKALHLDRHDPNTLKILEDYYQMTGQQNKIPGIRREAGLVAEESAVAQPTNYDDLILPMGTPESGPATPAATSGISHASSHSPLSGPANPGLLQNPGQPHPQSNPLTPNPVVRPTIPSGPGHAAPGVNMMPCVTCKKLIINTAVLCPYCGARQNSAFANKTVKTTWQEVAYRIFATILILMNVGSIVLAFLGSQGSVNGVVFMVTVFSGLGIALGVGLLLEWDIAQQIGTIVCIAGFLFAGVLGVVSGLMLLGTPLWVLGVIQLVLGLVSAIVYGMMVYLISFVRDGGIV